jgi:hypothetical protein
VSYVYTKISAAEWRERFEENARLSVFGEHVDPKTTRFDFSILCAHEKHLCIYTTVREIHSDHAYLSFGGSFPNVRGQTEIVRPAFLGLIDWFFSNGYDQITFHTKNTNYPMQRLSMHAGFVCVGTSTTERHILLEYNLKKEIK